MTDSTSQTTASDRPPATQERPHSGVSLLWVVLSGALRLGPGAPSPRRAEARTAGGQAL